MNDCKPDIKLAILLTGNELLEGSIVDTNSVFLSAKLLQYGIRTVEKRVIADAAEDLKVALLEMSSKNDILIINGGLGATVDDLTVEVVAEVCGQKLVQNPKAIEHLTNVMKKRYGTPVLDLPDYLQRQALLPEHCKTIDNPVGAALGFKLKIGGCTCYFTPGVPSELKAMFNEFIFPEIKEKLKLTPETSIERRNILGIGEYRIQNILFELLSETDQKSLNIGFRAATPHVELKVCPTSVQTDIADIMVKIDTCFNDYIFSEKNSLEESVIALIRQNKKTLVTAESCTGGLIASSLTQIPGVSDIYMGGLVTYSNQMKSDLLGVPPELIKEKGAVSQEVAKAMVRGALKCSGADYAIAVTGIAGPTGAENKPVGTVYVGVGSSNAIAVRKLLIQRKRTTFQLYTATTAIDLLRRYILDKNLNCYYHFDSLSDEKYLPYG